MKLNMFADFTAAIPLEDRLALIKENGFDGVMLGFSEEYKHNQFELADKTGLAVENVHSPFDRMNALWDKRSDSTAIYNRTADCIRICAENNVSRIVVHPTDGLVPPQVSLFGMKNFDGLISTAANYGVKLLFENIQLPSFLDILFDKFGVSESVGFCYDIGHENCFTKGEDRLVKHSGLLEALHIHDNEGSSDSHMLPFDGNIDYRLFAEKLKTIGYEGALSLEVFRDRSRQYTQISADEFVKKAKQAADRLEYMFTEGEC